MNELESFSPRHEGHHHAANIKYGYIVLGFSVVHIIGILICKSVFKLRWTTSTKGIDFVKSPLFISIIAWTLILIGLGVFHVQLPENYVTSIKRFGRMSYALLPFDIFLVLRPNSIGLRYLELIDLHKWMSRVIIAGAIIHGVGYFIKWILEGSLFTKLVRLWNFLGIVVFMLNLILIIISLRYFRRRIYQYFYVVHNITVWLFVGLICLHARPGVGKYAIACASLLGLQIFERYAKSHSISDLKVISYEGSNLIVVRIQRDLKIADWPSGSHIRLTYPLTNYRSWIFPTHPYTIASLESDEMLDLIISKSNRFILHPQMPYSWTGPFTSFSKELLQTIDNVDIICGGSGISFALPVFRNLKQKASHVKLIWCVRSNNDLHVLRTLNFNEEIIIHITGNLQDSTSNTIFDEEDYGLLDYDNNENFELESLPSPETPSRTVNDDSLSQDTRPKKESKFIIVQGRPDFGHTFESLVQVNSSNKWIIACGPRSLVNSAQEWASENKVNFVSEIYEM